MSLNLIKTAHSSNGYVEFKRQGDETRRFHLFKNNLRLTNIAL